MAAHIFKSATLFRTGSAALALGLGLAILPGIAAAQDRDGREWGEHRGGNRGDGGRGGRPAPDRPAAERPAQPGWNGSGWNRPATVQTAPVQSVPVQSAPAAVPPAARPEWRGEEPRFRQAAPDQPRNPAYADPRRDRSYGAAGAATVDNRQPPRQGWDGQRWNGQNWNDRRADGDRREERPRGPAWNGSAAPRPNWDRDGDRGWNGRDRNDRRESWSAGRGGNWDRDWRRDNRFNWQGWRNGHREVYRLGRYTPPYRSYAYRRLGIGFFLDGGFFGANYWINDPWMYRLPPAYGPYRWVRYYDDALLVDTYSGEVVDVIYDFFW